MSKYDQHLYDEWSPKNTTSLDDSFTSKKVWWECPKGHTYDATVYERSDRQRGCPYCCGRRSLKGFNDLQTLCPEIAQLWDYELNNTSPCDVTKG